MPTGPASSRRTKHPRSMTVHSVLAKRFKNSVFAQSATPPVYCEMPIENAHVWCRNLESKNVMPSDSRPLNSLAAQPHSASEALLFHYRGASRQKGPEPDPQYASCASNNTRFHKQCDLYRALKVDCQDSKSYTLGLTISLSRI